MPLNMAVLEKWIPRQKRSRLISQNLVQIQLMKTSRTQLKSKLKFTGASVRRGCPAANRTIQAPIFRGTLSTGRKSFGSKNTSSLQFLAFGDWRTAVAFNDNGAAEVGQLATRLNLDLDLKLTGTERIHAFVRPLDKGGNFTRREFAGGDREGGTSLQLDGNIETLFFEGDIGAIYSGIIDEHASFDLPVALGLTPFIFQNGVWVEDAFTGGAITLAAKTSPALNISNMDFTFFAGFDKVIGACGERLPRGP